jgi:antitoxin (DNA-binding transcriptional repressor) of toxin-antitoxin stability system
MKIITTEEAAERFEDMARLAHNGERILITRDGEPWVVLSPPANGAQNQSVTDGLKWPDFAARMARFFQEPAEGPTATELLSQDKEDRF